MAFLKLEWIAWELTEFPEPGSYRKICANIHHATPGASMRVNAGCIIWGTKWDT